MRNEGLTRNTSAVALSARRLSMTCCLTDQRVSCSTKPLVMLAGTLRIGHARGVVLFTIARHTDTLSSGWFHGSASLYGAVYSIHSIGRGVESSYGLHRFFTNHEIRWNQKHASRIYPG